MNRKFISAFSALIAVFTLTASVGAELPQKAAYSNEDNVIYAESATASTGKLNCSELTMIAMDDDSYKNYITMPSDMPTSFQLSVSGEKIKAVVPAEEKYTKSFEISDNGLVTPKKNTIEYIDGTTKTRYDYGKAKYYVVTDKNYYPVTLELKSYPTYYAENVMKDYISSHIKSNMTTSEKLTEIAKFVASYDYRSSHSDAVAMIVTGDGGNCWASTDAVVRMSRMIGLEGWARDGSKDPGAGSAHANAMIYDGTDYYEVEAGYVGTAPRGYSVVRRLSTYSTYKSDAGYQLYQYDERTQPGDELIIPSYINGNKVVGLYDFFLANNTDISSVVIPDTVESIGACAFASTKNLKYIYLPRSVKSVGGMFFNYYGDDDDKTVECDPANPYITVQDNIVYSKDKTKLFSCSISKMSKVPSTVSSIGYYAFYGNRYITQLTVPGSVSEIGNKAFANCRNLKKIIIEEGTKKLGRYLVQDSTSRYNQVQIVIPDSVTEIDRSFVTDKGVKCNVVIACSSDSYAASYAASNGIEVVYTDKGEKLPEIEIPDICKHDYKTVSYTQATCTSGGYKKAICSICNDVKEEYTRSTGHQYSDMEAVSPYKCRDGYLIKKCTVCGYESKSYTISATSHTYSEWTVTKAATCTATGTQTRKCSVCGKTETQTIEKIGHKEVVDKAVAATCIKTGLTEGSHCLVCGKVIKAQETVPATGKHTFGEWKTTKAATCTATGTQTRICSVCGKTETQTIAETAHKYLKTVVKPTYTAQGYTLHKCSVCGASYKDAYTAKLTLAKVGSFKAKTVTSTSVTLQWTKNANASGYELQQYKSGKWTTIATIGSNATVTYTVKGLNAGTAGYQFRIRAYKSVGQSKAYSDYSAAIKVNTNPYGVGGFKVKSKSSTSITLQWSKGTTASGYELQQYKNGKWTTIATIGSNATVTYTVKGLNAGTAGYRFRIRAYKTYGSTKQYSSWSSEVKVNTNPYGVGGFKVKSKSSTSITLQWDKGTTASGYELQQYKSGKWTTIATIGSNATVTYTVKGLNAGTAGYRFRIRAYKSYGNTKQYSSWSSEVKVNTNPYGVGGFKVKSTAKTSITLVWNKGTTASGYELQQYKNGKWVTVTTPNKATTVSYTVKGLKANTSYKFRIRAYKTYGSTKQYSSWSNTLTVKTKK